MEFLLLLVLPALAWRWAIVVEQSARVALLRSHLGRYHIETVMGALTEGYLKVLGQPRGPLTDAAWNALADTERLLLSEFNQLVTDFSEVWAEKTLVSRLPFAVPRATLLFPRATFDLREALALHAQGLARVVANVSGLSPRDRAFMLTAEMLLMQHSCLWFCRSLRRASAQLQLRHHTTHAQVLASVSPRTRLEYCALVGCRT